MLQKKFSRSISVAEATHETETETEMETDCRTAVIGEPCFAAVHWAKTIGVVLHPDWYTGLSVSSSFEDFQTLMHEGGFGTHGDGQPNYAGCGKPCPVGTPAPMPKPEPAPAPVPVPAPAPVPAPVPVPAPPAPAPAPGRSCHTTLIGERCYIDVRWAKDIGIRLHPVWYHGLSQSSSFEDFQMALHKQNPHRCPEPCAPGTPSTTPPPCHTPVEGERCYRAVRWAKAFGIKLHPDWYPGLTAGSSLRDFQKLLNKKGLEHCGKPCAAGTAPVPEPPAATPAPVPAPPPGSPTRFMSWNVYYLRLQDAGRVQGVAQGIAQVAPEIASIQEMWAEKPAILAELIRITGQSWSFAPGGETETVWDGDVLYRSDIWRHKASGVRKYEDRGLSWAVLERISDGVGVLVYGTHPWYTYPNDRPILETMKMATNDMKARQQKYPYPVVFMGDMNAHYELDSQRLLRSGSISAYGMKWCAPMTFMDSYAETHPDAPNPPSGNWPVKIDFVYFEKSPNRIGTVVGAKVWPGLPGGSDHFAVSGDIVLKPVSKDSIQNAKFLC